MRAGDDTPRAFLERCIETIDDRDGGVRAFVALDRDAARSAADAATGRWAAGKPLSTLDGCPVAVKDIVHTLDFPTQMNSPLYAGWRSPGDAAGVAALRAAGAVIIGKTHTTEFAVGSSPPTTNPWDRARTPGGSSSGSAASVGCGMVPLALGTQTVGSILRPASFCAAVGYKPSHGALPTGGLHPLSRTLDHLGPMGGSVADAWVAMGVMQREFGGDVGSATAWADIDMEARTPQRLGRLRVEADACMDGDAAAAFDEFLDGLRERGVSVDDGSTDQSLAALDDAIARANDLCMTILRYEMRWPLAEYAARGENAVGPRIQEHLAAAAKVGLDAYRTGLAARDELRELVRQTAAGFDGFVLPAASGAAPAGLEFTGDRTMLAPWSVVGGPAWSLPLLQVDDLPFGVQLTGAPGADSALAPVAAWLMGE
jgi:Asp-tRNA(Asn)/Glu-tRNA(Gln) amidotransferase A subunit family amidase